MSAKAEQLCSDEHIRAVLASAETDSVRGIEEIDASLGEYPNDPRLHFLKGSLLIGLRRFVEAHAAMSQALKIAPGFEIARFQLGFFELTSGEADAALATWAQLKALPAGHWMLHFVEGLEHLIADRFEECIAALRAGLIDNTENLPLNNDMQLIIGKCEDLLATAAPQPSEFDAVSATSLLLGSKR